MIIAGSPHTKPFKLVLPFGNWFCIFFLQILDAIVNYLAIILFNSDPADQFCLFEVFYLFRNCLSIHCGAPFFAGLQVNEPYFTIITFRYHNLLRADHLNGNPIQIFAFHILSEQYLYVAVSVEKKNSALLIIWVAGLSLFVHEKHESIVEGSEHITD